MEKKREEGKKHFVLIHGACHGAWCWYKITSLLKLSGHKVTALDMAASGVNPKKVQEVRSFSEYVSPLMEFMASLPLEEKEKVVLVGHSFGGACISVAMERFPGKVSVAVFVASVMPGPHLSLPTASAEYSRRVGSYMDTVFTYDEGLDKKPTSILFGPSFMATRLYQLSPPDDLTLALSLIRPLRLHNDTEQFTKESEVSEEKYGSVKRVYIICDRDEVILEDLQRWMIEKSPPDDVKLLDGSDHMVMFSKPQELFSCLQEIAQKYA